MDSEAGKVKAKKKRVSSKPYDRSLTVFGKLKKSVREMLTPSWWSGADTQAAAHDDDDNDDMLDQSCEEVMVVPAKQISGDGMTTLNRNQSSSFVSRHENFDAYGYKPVSGDVNVLGGGGGYGQRASKLTLPRTTKYFSEMSYMSPEQDGKVSTDSRGGGDSSSIDMIRTRDDQLSASRNAGGGLGAEMREESMLYDDTFDVSSGERAQLQPIMISTSRTSNVSSSSAAKRQKLLSSVDSTSRDSRPAAVVSSPSREKPYFNSFLFTSLSDSSALDDSFHRSIFYPGKTCFGGASAKKTSMFRASPAPYQATLPLRRQVTANRVGSKTFQATTSATAQRILETLDRMSTPLGDAKKTTLNVESSDSVLSFSPSSYRRSSLGYSGRPGTRPLELPSRAPPTSQHQVLSQAIIAKNRQTSAVVDKRQKVDVDASGTTSQQQDSSWLTTEGMNSNTKGGAERDDIGKMKSKKFTLHASCPESERNEVVEVPNLRTDFTLPISNMSPLLLQQQQQPPPASVPSTSSIPSYNNNSSSSNRETTVPCRFVFSAPIDERKNSKHYYVPAHVDERFTFTTPTKASQLKASAAGAEGESKNSPEPAVGASSGIILGASSAAFTTPNPALAPKPKLSSPDIGGTSSSFKSYNKREGYGNNDDSSAASDMPSGFSLAPAASLKSGSVMDILGGGFKSAPAQGTDDLMAKFKKPAGSWECGTCMIVNKPEASKCVACETSKPGAKPLLPAFGSDSSSSSSITGKLSVPGPAASSPATDDLMAKFKKPAGAWTCDTCMLTNKPDAGKCVACESAKPGAKLPQSQTGNLLFKKPAGSWECSTCMVQNTAAALRCVACDSCKPGLESAGIVPKTVSSSLMMNPGGGFTLSALQATTSGSSGFKFGNTSSSSTIPAPSSSLPAPTGFTFNQTSSSSATNRTASKPISTSNGSLTSASLAGGFKFGATAPGDDSGGGASGTSSFGVLSSSSGFMFGNMATCTSSTRTTESVSGGVRTSTPDKSQTLAPTTTVPSALSTNGDPSSVAFSKSNTFPGASACGFQLSNISSTGVASSSGVLQSSVLSDSKEMNTKLAQPHVNFSFAPVSSTSTTPSFTAGTSASEPAQPTAARPVSSLFQFGVPTSTPANSSLGLGMGSSLSDAKPMVNGGFATSFQLPVAKDTKQDLQGSSKHFTNVVFGTTPHVFGSFGQATAAPTPGSLIPQTSKRSVDLGDTEHSAAKKSFNFGSGSTTNEPFTFGGSSHLGGANAPASSTANFVFNSQPTSGPASRGGFQFGSVPSTTSAAAPGGGFQFGSVPSTTSAAAPGGGFQFGVAPSGTTPVMNFSLKASDDSAKFSFNAPASKAPIQFSTTPNFNFGSGSQPATGALFQFGAKPADSSTTTPAVFSFGGVQPTGIPADGSGFGASSGMGSVGGFNIGAGDPNRKVKKATRRVLKK